jgi:transglutaminase-like putative cysteine protease
LASGVFVDSNDPVIIEFAMRATENVQGNVAKAIALFLAVRDGVPYTPYRPYAVKEMFHVGTCLADDFIIAAGRYLKMG